MFHQKTKHLLVCLGILSFILFVPLVNAWWDSDWGKYKNYTITNPDAYDHTKDLWYANLTGLTLSTNNCSRELRLIIDNTESDYLLISDDGQSASAGSQWCLVGLNLSVSSSSSKNVSVYYNNPSASLPSYISTSGNENEMLDLLTTFYNGTGDPLQWVDDNGYEWRGANYPAQSNEDPAPDDTSITIGSGEESKRGWNFVETSTAAYTIDGMEANNMTDTNSYTIIARIATHELSNDYNSTGIAIFNDTHRYLIYLTEQGIKVTADSTLENSSTDCRMTRDEYSVVRVVGGFASYEGIKVWKDGVLCIDSSVTGQNYGRDVDVITIGDIFSSSHQGNCTLDFLSYERDVLYNKYTYSIGEEQTLAPEENSVILQYPDDESTNTSLTIDFGYKPIFYFGKIYNCSLYTNETSWSLKHSNSSVITNNSINIIQETFSADNTYKWNVECWNSTNSVFASSNWTVEATSPPSAPTSITCNDTNCNNTFTNVVDINASGSTDEGGDTITYNIWAYFNDGTTSEEWNYSTFDNVSISSTRYLSWPAIVKVANGDLIVMYSNDTAHGITIGRKIWMTKSTDNGSTWGTPEIVFENSSYDVRNLYDIVRAPDDDLFAFPDYANSTHHICYISKSTDNGTTWSTPEIFDTVNPERTKTVSSHIIVGNTIYIVTESYDESNIWNSTDNGSTWNRMGIIQSNSTKNAEPGIINFNDTYFYVITRGLDPTDYHAWVINSTDAGATWGAPVDKSSELGQFEKVQMKFFSGKLYSFGRYVPTADFVFYTAFDNSTWGNRTIIENCNDQADCGYESIAEINSTHTLIVFYSDIFNNLPDIRQVWFKATSNQTGDWNYSTFGDISPDSTRHYAYPGGTIADDGTLYTSFRNSTGGGWTANSVCLLYNSTDGETWTFRETFWQESGKDCPDNHLFKAPDGTLFGVVATVTPPSGNDGCKIKNSTDNGSTWGSWEYFDSVRANRTLIISDTAIYDNTIFLITFGFEDATDPTPVYSAFLWNSTDNGSTYNLMSIVINENEVTEGVSESTLLIVNSTYFIVISRETTNTYTYSKNSTDGGFTWGSLVDKTSELGKLHDPRAFWLSGHAYIFGGDYTGSTRNFVYYTAYDNDTFTWGNKTVIYETTYGAYNSPINFNSTHLNIPFQTGTSTNADIDWVWFNTSGGKQWHEIGNHTEGSSYEWDFSSYDNQTDVDLKARAIDISGTNTYSDFFDPYINMTLLIISEEEPITCSIKASCDVGEVCLFSVYRENNTHTGHCNYYSSKLCCDTITSAIIKDTCAADEVPLISFYQVNNTHTGNDSYYTKFLCVKPNITAVIRDTSCNSGESTIFSVYKENNTHIGRSDYYNKKFCIKLVGGQIFERIFSQVICLDFTPDRGFTVERIHQQDLKLLEQQERTFNLQQEFSNLVQFDSQFSRTINFAKWFEVPLTFSFESFRTGDYLRDLDTHLELDTNWIRNTNLLKYFDTNLILSSQMSRQSNLISLFSTHLQLTSTFSRLGDYNKILNTDLALTSTYQGLEIFNRIFSSNIILDATFSGIFEGAAQIFERVFNVFLEFSGEYERNTIMSRPFSLNLDLSSQFSRNINLIKIFNTNLLEEISFFGTIDFERVSTTNLLYSFESLRTSLYNRFFNPTFIFSSDFISQGIWERSFNLLLELEETQTANIIFQRFFESGIELDPQFLRTISVGRIFDLNLELSSLFEELLEEIVSWQEVIRECVVPHYFVWRDLKEAINFCFTYYRHYQTPEECFDYCLMEYDDTQNCAKFCNLEME